MTGSRVPADIAQQVRTDAGHRCGYCRASESITSMSLTFDHLIPQAAGGLTVRENLWLACERCNRHKADRVGASDPVSGDVVPLFNPRTQVWRAHFSWSVDGVEVVGLTPTGRATVVALNLNHPLAIIARRLWVRVGWHPPLE